MSSCLLTLQMSESLGVRSIRYVARSLLGALLLQFTGLGIGLLAQHVRLRTDMDCTQLRNRTLSALQESLQGVASTSDLRWDKTPGDPTSPRTFVDRPQIADSGRCSFQSFGSCLEEPLPDSDSQPTFQGTDCTS